MKIIVDNLLINYSDQGKGKVILAIHGWTNDGGKSFGQLGENLAKNYRVITPDLPGFGQSGQPPETWGIPEYAQLVKKFLQKIDVTPDFILAHSNGGAIALYLLGNTLLTPQKLVLLSSAGVREKEKFKKSILALAAKPVKLVLKPLPKAVQESIKKRTYQNLGSDLYVMENMQPVFKRIVGYDIQSIAQKVTQPTLFIYGANDSSTPVRFGEMFVQIVPQARLEIVQNAGHFVFIDQLEKTAKLIEDFLG